MKNLVSHSGLRFGVIHKAGAWRLTYRRNNHTFEIGSDTSLSRLLRRLEKLGICEEAA